MGFHLCFKKGQHISLPHLCCRGTESPMSILTAPAEGAGHGDVAGGCAGEELWLSNQHRRWYSVERERRLKLTPFVPVKLWPRTPPVNRTTHFGGHLRPDASLIARKCLSHPAQNSVSTRSSPPSG